MKCANCKETIHAGEIYIAADGLVWCSVVCLGVKMEEHGIDSVEHQYKEA